MSVATEVAEERSTRRWSALGGVLLSALYLWVVLWLLLAIILPTVGLGWQPAVITSGSMQPLIRPGDVVLTSPTSEVEPGHVVTFEDPARDGTLTTHRVLGFNQDGSLRTRGDANDTADSTPVPIDGLVGRGRLLVPLVGLPLVWLSTGFVLFGLWVVATAISVMVVAGRTGVPARRTSNAGSTATARPGLRVLRWLGPLRPHRVQRALVVRLVRVARRVHDAVYRGWRPNPSRARRAAPSTAILVATGLLARSPAAVTIGVVGLVLVVLFDPDGPQLRIGRWERLIARALRPVAAVLPSAGLARGLLVVVAVVAVTAPTVARSAAAFRAMDGNSGNHFTASATFPSDADLTLWLQDEPEDTDTADATYSPMTADQPTQDTLYNYDVGDDTDPGLRIQPGATSAFEADDTRVQRWTHTPAGDLTIASAELLFHSAVKDFVAGGATVTWYLRHCDASGGDCVAMATTTVTSADWQEGTTDFVARTTGFGTVSHVVPGGRQLELTLTVPAAASDLWFAYDTVDSPSRLEITTGTAGACPGSGTSVQHVTADTRMQEEDPNTNFSTALEIDTKSDSGQDRRSLLTVALPTLPDGCSLTGATLLLTTTTSALDRTIVTQRVDAAFDPATVTWTTQPLPVAGSATGSGPSTAVGPTPIDATGPVGELYTQGNTGLQLRDSAEDAALIQHNQFHSTESRPYPDPEGPRLEVTWGP